MHLHLPDLHQTLSHVHLPHLPDLHNLWSDLHSPAWATSLVAALWAAYDLVCLPETIGVIGVLGILGWLATVVYDWLGWGFSLPF